MHNAAKMLSADQTAFVNSGMQALLSLSIADHLTAVIFGDPDQASPSEASRKPRSSVMPETTFAKAATWCCSRI